MLITSKSHHLSINAIKMNTIDTLTNINDMTLNCWRRVLGDDFQLFV